MGMETMKGRRSRGVSFRFFLVAIAWLLVHTVHLFTIPHGRISPSRPGWKDSRGPQVTRWHPGRGAGRFNQQLRWRCSLQCPSSASSQRWLHAGVALRARAAREDNNAEDRLDLEEAIAEAERVLQDNDKVEKIKAVLRKAQKINPGKWTLSGKKDELKQKLREFVEEAKATKKGLEEDSHRAQVTSWHPGRGGVASRASPQQDDWLAKSREEVEGFSIAQVSDWVRAVLLAAGFEADDITEVTPILLKQKVIGAALLKLTLEELMQDGVPRGPAKLLAEKIQLLQEPQVSRLVQELVLVVKQKAFDNALSKLRDIAVLPEHAIQDEQYCHPYQLAETWHLVAFGQELLDNYRSLSFDSASSRAPRLMALSAGTGTGKTHSLLEAPKALASADRAWTDCEFIYITYNQEQDLTMDLETQFFACQKAVLWRLMLRQVGTSNQGCGKALRHLMNIEISPAEILQMFVNAAAKPNVVICVDELQLLQEEGVKAAASTLASVALALSQASKRCLVLLAALTDETLKSVSERPALTVNPILLDNSGREFIVDRALPNATAKQKTNIKGAAGLHARSIVVACQQLSQYPSIDSVRIAAALKSRLGVRLRSDDRADIREYIKMSMTTNVEDALKKHPLAKPFADPNGAIPPALTIACFETTGNTGALHPACCIFAPDLFDDASKALERAALYRDQFRALYSLPVVPQTMLVQNTNPRRAEWFHQLRFPLATAQQVCRESLFEVRNKQTVRTRLRLQEGVYYFPGAANHPRIDRAVIAYHLETNTQCLVIYQDKLNQNLPKAVRSLNEAADSFCNHIQVILCVAIAAQATDATNCQSKFRYPYLLVREGDISNFFSPTFAAAITFIQDRHRID
ncbi:unnamed protein product [Effrenium voratum]|uniref:SAM domain-containing protein n=1 Tax=Effrenium voratum TaxID=2562239 RepID=A0AA36HKA7_9DINO|nr:unnamed protein product [Effrenium voratum]